MHYCMIFLNVNLTQIYLKTAYLRILEHALPDDREQDPPILCLLFGKLLGLEEEVLVEHRYGVLIDLGLG